MPSLMSTTMEAQKNAATKVAALRLLNVYEQIHDAGVVLEHSHPDRPVYLFT